MKRTLVILISLVMLCGFAYSQAKIGIINAQKILEGTKKGKAIAAKLERIGKEKQTKLEAYQAQVQKLEKELMSPALNEATKEKKGLELQNKKTEAKRFIEDTQREMQRMQAKEIQKLQEEVRPIIMKYGKDNGFTLILDMGMVTYFDQSIDITNDIIKIMDGQ